MPDETPSSPPPPPPPTGQAPAPEFPGPKDRFEAVKSQLQEILKIFVDFQFRQSSILLLILGAVTGGLFAKGPYELPPELKVGVAGLASVLVVFHGYWVWIQYLASQKTFKLLDGNLEQKYLDVLVIHKVLAISFIVVYFLIALAGCLLIGFWPIP